MVLTSSQPQISGSFKADHRFVVYRFHSHGSLLVVIHPAPDHRLCLQLATYLHRTMFHHVYCTVQISVYCLLSVMTLKQAPLYSSIFVNFPTQRTRFRCICFINRLDIYAVFLANLLNSCYY